MQVPKENKNEAVHHLTAFLETVNAPLKHEIFDLKQEILNLQTQVKRQSLLIEEQTILLSDTTKLLERLKDE